jgi:hypothetical protein
VKEESFTKISQRSLGFAEFFFNKYIWLHLEKMIQFKNMKKLNVQRLNIRFRLIFIDFNVLVRIHISKLPTAHFFPTFAK